MKNIYIDMKIPTMDFDKTVVFFNNFESDKILLIDDLKVETYNE